MEYTLIRNSLNQIFTFDKNNNQWIETGLYEPLNIDQIKKYGITNINTLTESEWNALPYENIEVLTWTDNENTNVINIVSQNGFKPIDLIDNPKLVIFTDTNEKYKIKLDILAKMKLRIAISKDNRNTWYIFRNGGWKQILLSNMTNDGMLVSEINAITEDNFKSWFKRGTLDFAIYSSSQSNIEFLQVRKIEVNFPENESPYIENLLITPNEISRNNVLIKAKIRDLEGDLARYKILINNEPYEFKDNDGWSDWIDCENGYNIEYSLPFYYFQPNDNTVQIIAEDDRGKQTQTVPQIIKVINNSPVATVVTHNNWCISGVITDIDKDDIRYRVLINDKQVYPKTQKYTDFFPTPYNLYYEWNKDDLTFNEKNIITIEILDKANGKHTIQFNDIIGKYKNLMFKDENNNYYTDDKGELIPWKNNIMSYLDFGIMIAGSVSEPKKVLLENNLSQSVDNVKVYLDTKDLVGYDVHVSKNQDFLVNTGDDPNLHEITYDGIMNVNDIKEFYVRVSSNIHTKEAGGIFKILTTSKFV